MSRRAGTSGNAHAREQIFACDARARTRTRPRQRARERGGADQHSSRMPFFVAFAAIAMVVPVEETETLPLASTVRRSNDQETETLPLASTVRRSNDQETETLPLASTVRRSNDLCDAKSPTEYACCAHLFVNDTIIHLNDTACADISYLSASEELDLSITLNGRELFEDKFDLKDLSKECVGIPYIKKDAQVCLHGHLTGVAGLLTRPPCACAQICVDFDDILLNTSYIGACVRAAAGPAT